ncbi:hypothetical protein [Herminiimonas fonticola]|uniref:Uncharacterized protein n=1 Tax=Herminiimonas fonticola TaxID=303380 RepID=A0A4R6GFU5_9BURK|nr:hypothetical protein [Herminiimonas fonticola]RBA24605.1 hypothetical protein Hfont_0238 [Herminiimonas fonticola]TDN93722.1 hypothetical protein EV677_0252 [Herminiimonas fonticola]
MRPLVRNLHASYIAYMLQWSPRLQELFTVMLMNGSGGLTSAVLAKVMRPSVAHIKARIAKRDTASDAIVQQG